MNKIEFLEKLKEALSGQVPGNVVKENLQYYDSYIKGEVKNGKKELEVISEIGDPRLIAKSIIEVTPEASDGGFDPYAEQAERSSHQTGGVQYYDLNKWYWKVLAVALVIAVLALVFMVLTGVLSLIVSFLPAIVVVAIVMWIMRRI